MQAGACATGMQSWLDEEALWSADNPVNMNAGHFTQVVSRQEALALVHTAWRRASTNGLLRAATTGCSASQHDVSGSAPSADALQVLFCQQWAAACLQACRSWHHPSAWRPRPLPLQVWKVCAPGWLPPLPFLRPNQLPPACPFSLSAAHPCPPSPAQLPLPILHLQATTQVGCGIAVCRQGSFGPEYLMTCRLPYLHWRKRSWSAMLPRTRMHP